MTSNNNWSPYLQQQQNPQQYPYPQQCNPNPIYNNYASQPPPPPPPPQYQGYAVMGNKFPGQHFQLDAAAVDTSCNQVYGIPPPPPPPASASTPYGYSYQHNMNTPPIVPPPPPPPTSHLISNNTRHSSNHLNIHQTNLNTWNNNQDINRNNHLISKQLKNSKTRNKNTASSQPNPTTDKNTTTSIYECDICSKIENTSVTFPSSRALQNHMDAHVTCKHPNCNFIASKKLVSAHYSSKHGKFSGRGLKSITIQMPGSKKLQRFKICVGNHPDDIKSWIEERKKKFPTRKRILEKNEWREKGRMEGALGYGRKNDSDSRGATGISGVSNKRGGFEDSAENNEAKRIKNENNVDNIDGPMTNSDEGSKKNQKGKDKEQEGKHFVSKDNSLTSLVAGYGSSDDDESSNNSNKDGNHDNDGGATNSTNIGIDITRSKSDTNVSMKSQENTLAPQSMQSLPLPSQKSMKEEELNDENNNNEQIHGKSRMCRFFLRNGSCLNGEKCTYIHDVGAHESYIAVREVKRQMQSQRDRARNEALREMDTSPSRQGSSTGNSKKSRGIDNNGTKMPVGLGGQTLLSKLLENDMRRERSLTLQLLRYIVDCNYLQEKREIKEDKKESKEKDVNENVDICNDDGASDTCNVVEGGAKNLIIE